MVASPRKNLVEGEVSLPLRNRVKWEELIFEII